MDVILQLALALVDRSAQQFAGQAWRTTLFVLVALVFALFGLAGLAGALWIVLAREIGPALAALILGGVSLMLAGVIALVAVARQRQRRRDRELLTRQIESALTAMMANETAGSVWVPLLAAALAGFLLTGRR